MLHLDFFDGQFSVNLFFIPVLLIMLVIGGVASVSAFFMALLIHETAHIAAAYAFGIGIGKVELMPFGCVAQTEGFYMVSGAKEAIVAAFGPAANILVSALILLSRNGDGMSAYMSCFYTANVSLAAVNLLPVLPMDGGRVLCVLLGTVFKKTSALSAMGMLGIAFSTAAIALGVYMAVRGQANPTVFLAGGFMLITSIGYLKSASLDVAKHALYKPREFAKRGVTGVRTFAVHKEKTLGRVLLQLDAKKYNIVYIVDDDLHVIRELDEGQILDHLLTRGTAARLDKVL